MGTPPSAGGGVELRLRLGDGRPGEELDDVEGGAASALAGAAAVDRAAADIDD